MNHEDAMQIVAAIRDVEKDVYFVLLAVLGIAIRSLWDK